MAVFNPLMNTLNIMFFFFFYCCCASINMVNKDLQIYIKTAEQRTIIHTTIRRHACLHEPGKAAVPPGLLLAVPTSDYSM